MQVISSPEGGIDPKYQCWLNLGEHLSGNLHGSPGSVKEWGRRMGSTVAQSLYLVLCPSMESLLNAERPGVFSMGTGTVSKFSKGNHQLWLFYLSETMKAVFLLRSWVCHSRQAQAGGRRCMFTCLFGPSLQAEHTRMWAACHSVSQATTASRFGRSRLLMTTYVLPASWPLRQGRPFANFLCACKHLHMSTQLAWLRPNHQYLGGVTREKAAHLTAGCLISPD